MRLREYEVHVSADSVDARWDNSDRPAWHRLLGIVAATFWGALLAYVGLFRPDRNGYSGWWRLMHDNFTSRFVIDAVIPVCYVFLVWELFASIGVRSFFTSGQMLHCDRSQLTVAKIPWINFNGKWKSLTFPIAAVANLELAVWSSRTRETYYLIRFRANEKKQKAVAGITAQEGYRLLKGLKALGVDVHHDPGIQFLAREEIRGQRAEL